LRPFLAVGTFNIPLTDFLSELLVCPMPPILVEVQRATTWTLASFDVFKYVLVSVDPWLILIRKPRKVLEEDPSVMAKFFPVATLKALVGDATFPPIFKTIPYLDKAPELPDLRWTLPRGLPAVHEPGPWGNARVVASMKAWMRRLKYIFIKRHAFLKLNEKEKFTLQI
jgi:hypothetical protein